MEFVVVGSGNGPEEVDIRGWRFRVTSNPGVNDSSSPRFSFQLKNNPALAKIPAGTILTFTAGDDILPSVLNDDINALSEGFFHTNINLYDLTFVEMSESTPKTISSVLATERAGPFSARSGRRPFKE